jgi:hypothetical protein
MKIDLSHLLLFNACYSFAIHYGELDWSGVNIWLLLLFTIGWGLLLFIKSILSPDYQLLLEWTAFFVIPCLFLLVFRSVLEEAIVTSVVCCFVVATIKIISAKNTKHRNEV